MALVKFYTKPGCLGGLKQKELLCASGHTIDEHSVLSTPWTPETLRPYFSDLPVGEWFNMSAPAVKSGKVIPCSLSEEDTLALFCREPILIRRPLMEINGQKIVGFNVDKLAKIINLNAYGNDNLDGCQMMDSDVTCDELSQ
ncbi:hypothetical protein [Pectinatus haikarae]|uniref:Nitrogenase-associated protein n=1 Tax=Pectinatus haikarae TaxID=349096 RepID=A0ABT9Y5X0_9FIRM|nr:hypothetical protein [Pectinatus haikarae]MDQ0203228.1 nitrogenase-associated protein [Pectinatus haikarae]